jgi:hypothetical protein
MAQPTKSPLPGRCRLHKQSTGRDGAVQYWSKLMRSMVFFLSALCWSLALPAAAQAVTCFPVTSEVVSLGENAAKAYAERSLDRGIEKEQDVIASRGEAVGRITREELNCAPFPNLLGADEWRCVGAAKVCVEG